MKLTTTRRLAAALATTAVAAAGLAAPAFADPPLLNGTFTGDGGADEFVWTIATACADGGCTGTVSSNQGWTSPTTFTDGRWAFMVTKPDGAICDDGSYAPAYISLSVDPVTLDGTISADSNYGCPGGQVSETPFQLKQVG